MAVDRAQLGAEAIRLFEVVADERVQVGARGGLWPTVEPLGEVLV